MGKILVALEVPAIDEVYDLFIPDFLTMGECTELLSRAVSDMTQGRYVPSGKEVLLHSGKEGHTLLDQKYTAADYGFQNGDRLYIF